jgi:hypothetical protein
MAKGIPRHALGIVFRGRHSLILTFGIVEQIMKIMPAEIRATVPLYLDGKIQQWFTRGDGKGVIFILNCKDVAEARALMENLPLSKENLVDEQFIPVGPLLPLGILLRDSPANK